MINKLIKIYKIINKDLVLSNGLPPSGLPPRPRSCPPPNLLPRSPPRLPPRLPPRFPNPPLPPRFPNPPLPPRFPNPPLPPRFPNPTLPPRPKKRSISLSLLISK